MATSATTSQAKETPTESQTAVYTHWQRYWYRWLTGLVVLLALALTFLPTHDQRRLRLPNPWSNELATANFAQSKWVLNDEEAAAARAQVRQRGGRLTQYLEISPGRWAFRQAPGHPLEMAPFYLLGYPQLANIFLATAAALVLYLLLAAWYSERFAFVGVTVLLWSPISLIALHYYNMDTFAGGILPLIAGALLFWVEKREIKQWKATFFLFIVGLVLGWSVVVRLTNVLLLPLFSLYLLLLALQYIPGKRQRKRRKAKQRQRQRPTFTVQRQELVRSAAFILGCLLALTSLAVYDYVVFGNVVDTGYAYYSPDDPLYLWKENPVTHVPGGVPTWLAGGAIKDIALTLVMHIRLWLRPISLAFPLWPLALLGLIQLLRRQPMARSTWFLSFWLLLVYLPYAGVVFFGVTRALAVPYNQLWGFFVPARYLYPFIFPFILTLIFLFSRLPRRGVFGLTGVYMLAGAGLYWFGAFS